VTQGREGGGLLSTVRLHALANRSAASVHAGQGSGAVCVGRVEERLKT
jgi:hypothetical protein